MPPGKVENGDRGGRIYIHYTYWMAKWDEWIDRDSERLAPAGSRVCKSPSIVPPSSDECCCLNRYDCLTDMENGVLREGHRIEALDTYNKWLEASVLKTNATEVLIHYKVSYGCLR